ncbi:MAG: hypothetical protein KAR13_00985, partial [Desulfobulbaceae bacterium]|nr:hypothetical protein [Desulfobulbaceae bacterium]
NGGFRIRLHAWEKPDYDGDHTTEDVMYIVVEAGRHTVPLDGGGNIEFDARIVPNVTACGTDNFLTVNYNTAFSSPPLLFTGLSTYKGPDMTITRNKDVTATNFKVVLQESEKHGSKDCTHPNPEEIHCIAVSPGAGIVTGTGILIEVGTWPKVDNNGWRKIQYTTVFPEDALVVTDMQTTREADPAILRFKKAIDDSVMVRVREDTTDDKETNHAKETVGYLAVTGGGSAFNIKVGVQTEPTGIIQDLSSKVRFGLAVYNYDHSKNPTSIYNNNTVNGGTFNPCYPDVTKDVDDRTNYDICRETHTKAPLENIVKVIETHPLIWGTTPIAETLYEIYGFFGQIDHTSSRSNVQFYANGTDGNNHCFGADNQYTLAACEAAGGTWQNADSYRISNDFDPYYYYEAGAMAPCAMSFVLHFNDGAPFKDWDAANTNPNIFGGGTDYDGDGNGGPQEILDDLALYLRDNDIRSDDSPNTHQEIISYYVYAALGEGELNNSSTNKMREAAVNGGFEDRDDDYAPDPAHPANFINYIKYKKGCTKTEWDLDAANCNCTENEWDSDADCNPDTFYNADNG